MERNKRILLQALVLLNFLSLCSCVDKVVYTYEDIVITRYDCLENWRPNYKSIFFYPYYTSVFYCNKSDKECRVNIYGDDYSALLCINRETKKVWIIHDDCYIEQSKVDYTHFQAQLNNSRGGGDSLALQEIKTLKRTPELLEEKYECFVLQGMGDCLRREKPMSKEVFPNSKIEAQYYYNLLYQK